MSIAYNTTLKNTRMTDVVTALDAGSGPAVLVIGTSALAGDATGVLVSIPLDDPAATVTGGVLTLSSVPLSATAIADGTAAKAELRDSDGTVVASGLTVDTSGASITVLSTSITTGETVQVTSGTITHG